MLDFQGQFIPDGRTLICKGALTIGLGFDSGDSKNVSDEELRHLEDGLGLISIVAQFQIKSCNIMKKFYTLFFS